MSRARSAPTGPRDTVRPTHADQDIETTAVWYLTVRCANAACGRLIAFQKSVSQGDDPELRIAITGKPSIDCPHCKITTRFRCDQIERRQVIMTQ
jgi:hypothetical protein